MNSRQVNESFARGNYPLGIYKQNSVITRRLNCILICLSVYFLSHFIFVILSIIFSYYFNYSDQLLILRFQIYNSESRIFETLSFAVVKILLISVASETLSVDCPNFLNLSPLFDLAIFTFKSKVEQRNLQIS